MELEINPKPVLRDFQRKKLYRFEESVLEKHTLNQVLTLEGCTALARKYNPTIVVKDGRGRRHAGLLLRTTSLRCRSGHDKL